MTISNIEYYIKVVKSGARSSTANILLEAQLSTNLTPARLKGKITVLQNSRKRGNLVGFRSI